MLRTRRCEGQSDSDSDRPSPKAGVLRGRAGLLGRRSNEATAIAGNRRSGGRRLGFLSLEYVIAFADQSKAVPFLGNVAA